MLSPTTQREGLLRLGSLPCLCTLQPWRGTARCLRSFRTCTTTRMQLQVRNVQCKQNCLCKRPPITSSMYRGSNCCTTHVARATDVFAGLHCILHVEQFPERVPTDLYVLFSACSIDMLPPRPSPLQHSHPCLSPTYTRSVFEGRFKLLRPSVRHAFAHNT